MGKLWKPSDWKAFAREAQLDRPYYVQVDLNDHAQTYEDSGTYYTTYVFDRRAWPTNQPTCGSMTAGQLCRNFGPVYEHTGDIPSFGDLVDIDRNGGRPVNKPRTYKVEKA